MEDANIKLLYICSKTHALININQSPAGETGTAPITQPVPANASFFITMLPLGNEKGLIFLPYTRKVSIASGGAVYGNDGLIDLCVWPDNTVELMLYPQAVYKSEGFEVLPSMISPHEFNINGERHTAYIYDDAASNFAVEQYSSNRLVFLASLPFRAASAEITFMRLADTPIIFAAGKTAEGKSFVYAANTSPFSTAICTVCETYRIEGNRISVVTEGEFKQVRTIYERSETGLTPAITELGWFTCDEKEPSVPEEVFACLLQALKANASEAALRCLTPSLSEGLSFGDLKEFFGDFTLFTKPLSPLYGQNSIALKYQTGKSTYSARVFSIDTKQSRGGLLIDNIREP
jgi:hypothetical protein